MNQITELLTEIFHASSTIGMAELLTISMAPLTAFVAIGVPVSFGVLRSYAERFRTSYLVRHINQRGVISAQTILVTSALYLVVSFVLVGAQPGIECGSESEAVWKLVAFLLMILYLLIIAATATWYAHLFRMLSMTPDQLISSLKEKSNDRSPSDMGWM